MSEFKEKSRKLMESMIDHLNRNALRSQYEINTKGNKRVMKVLCICQGGNSRSVGCGYLLKYKYGLDALACGWEGNKPETLRMLCQWADAIIVMQDIFKQYVPEDFHSKLFVIDVGEDIWGNSLHPDLLAKCDRLLQGIIKRIE